MLNIDILKFIEVVKKSTLNYAIDNVQIKFRGDRIISKMISSSRDVIVNINIPNDCIDNIDDVDFNFNQPSTHLLPFLNLIDESEDIKIEVRDEKIIIVNGMQKSNIHFCDPMAVNVFSGNDNARNVDYFHSITIDDKFLESFKIIKKIGPKFGKIYFNVIDGIFSIETTDKSSRYSNGLKFNLQDVDNVSNRSIMFKYKNLVDLINVIDISENDYKINFSDVLIHACSNDKKENFYVFAVEEM